MSPWIPIAAVIGYLLGSLPFGYLVARAKGVNIFEVGSKSPGATNVRRVLGKGPGNLVFALDALKGAVATAWPLCTRLEAQPLMIAGLAGALLGHSFSCFTQFRGGKGVATGAGGFVVLFPLGAGVALGAWLLTLWVFRFVSVASMTAAVALVITAWFAHASSLVLGLSVVVMLFVIVRHRANIRRLLAGTESRIGGPRPPANPS